MTNEYEGDAHHVINVRMTEPAPASAELVYGVYQLVVFQTGADAVKQILTPSDRRICAYVQALDDDVTLAGLSGDAAKGAGSVVPQTNSAPWPIHDQGAVYAAVTSFSGPTSRLSVTAFYRKEQ